MPILAGMQPFRLYVDTFKGGVGKTTSARWLAWSAAERGATVLAVATSIQNDLFPMPSRMGSGGGWRTQIRRSIPAEARAVNEHLWYLPAGSDEIPLDADPRPVVDEVARSVGATVVVVDGINFLQSFCWGFVAWADAMVIPSTLEPESVAAARRVYSAVRNIVASTPGLPLRWAAMLLTSVPSLSRMSSTEKRILSLLQSEEGDRVLPGVIHWTARRQRTDDGLALAPETNVLKAEYASAWREIAKAAKFDETLSVSRA